MKGQSGNGGGGLEGRRSVRVAWLLAGLGLAVFAVLAVLVAARWTALLRLDLASVRDVHGPVAGNTALRVGTEIVTTVGAPLLVDVGVVVAAAVLAWAGRRRAAAVVLIARVLSQAGESGFKILVGRHRPPREWQVVPTTGWSFPSGHATGATALSVSLVLALGLTSGRAVVAGLLAVAVAGSRVLLGVHYLSDVVAGLALGVAAAGAAVLLVGGSAARGRPGVGVP